MKITIEFDSEEDARHAINASNYRGALDTLYDRLLRPAFKHGYNCPILDSVDIQVYEKLVEILNEHYDYWGVDS